MGFVEKIKLLFKVQKPAGEIVAAVKEAKKSKKWLHLSVVILGQLAATAGSLTGVIPPIAQLISVTVLQAAYNILRGADKADLAEVKGTFRTSEFWMTGLSEIQKSFVAFQTGGWYPEWMATAAAINGFALSLGQNLAARAPIASDVSNEVKSN